MEREGKQHPTLNFVANDGDEGDPQPDGSCNGLVGCIKYDPCPLKVPVAGDVISSTLSREIARRVKTRLGI